MTEEQIKYMVDRFLGWRLPEDFKPDAGISFKATFNEYTSHPMRHEPSGTNLFDATQATDMVRYMAEGMPAAEGRNEKETDQALEVLLLKVRDVIDALDPCRGIRAVDNAISDLSRACSEAEHETGRSGGNSPYWKQRLTKIKVRSAIDD